MIEVANLSVASGPFRLSGISLTLPTGRYGVLMGKTGTGKTTLLESILGLRPVQSGRIRLLGEDVTERDPAVRGIGYVPQDGALFTTMTVREHLALALVVRHVPAMEIRRRVDELGALLEVTHLMERRPRGLSGGERQRVALGRALSFRPRVLCLDEPLSALDYESRLKMCELLEQVQHQTGTTVLHVTHNRDEAERLADCLFCLQEGQIETRPGKQITSH